MIQHDMMIKLIDMPEKQKKEACLKIKELIEGLKEEIPQIKSVHVGINISPRPITFDLIASSVYENNDDLEAFRAHKAHLKAVEYIRTVEKQSALVDHII
jgi:valyl-tRNA synthetase